VAGPPPAARAPPLEVWVVVTRVAEDGPNADVLHVGDRIVSVGGQKVGGDASKAVGIFRSHAEACKEEETPDATLSVTLLRLADPIAIREADEAEEAARQAAFEAAHPFHGVHGQLENLDMALLRVVDPSEAERLEELTRDAARREQEQQQQLEPQLERDRDQMQADGKGAAEKDGEAPLLSARAKSDGGASAAREGGGQTSPRSVHDATPSGSRPSTAQMRPPGTSFLLAAAAARRFGDKGGSAGGGGTGLSLSEQAAQRQVERAWERALNMRLRVVLLGGEKTLELTGRQVMGLHGHASKSSSGQVAFEHRGEKEVLSLAALEKLKRSLEAKALGSVTKPPPRPRPASSIDLAEMAGEAVEGTFRCLDVAQVKDAYEEGLLKKLPSVHWVEREHPEWLAEETLSVDDACSLAQVGRLLAVSHRWEGGDEPDPHGVQLTAIMEYLERHGEGIERLWVDYSCTPLLAPGGHDADLDDAASCASHPPSAAASVAASDADANRGLRLVGWSPPRPPTGATGAGESVGRPDTAASVKSAKSQAPPGTASGSLSSAPTAEPTEEDRLIAESARTVELASLPFLCCRCLLLVDSGYLNRFWTGYEAWLSLKRLEWNGGEGGEALSNAPPGERCAIIPLRDEPGFMATLLVETWRNKAPKEAFEALGALNAPAAFPASQLAAAQLAKLERLQRWLRTAERQEGGRLAIPYVPPEVDEVDQTAEEEAEAAMKAADEAREAEEAAKAATKRSPSAVRRGRNK
jgi:hypothetical protein